MNELRERIATALAEGPVKACYDYGDCDELADAILAALPPAITAAQRRKLLAWCDNADLVMAERLAPPVNAWVVATVRALAAGLGS
jgi:hypothetical protein